MQRTLCQGCSVTTIDDDYLEGKRPTQDVVGLGAAVQLTEGGLTLDPQIRPIRSNTTITMTTSPRPPLGP